MPNNIYLTYRGASPPEVVVSPLKVEFCQDGADDQDIVFVNLSTGKALQIVFPTRADRTAFKPALRPKDVIVLEPYGTSEQNRQKLTLRNRLGIQKRNGGCNFAAADSDLHRYGITYIVRDITVSPVVNLVKVPGSGDPDIVVEC